MGWGIAVGLGGSPLGWGIASQVLFALDCPVPGSRWYLVRVLSVAGAGGGIQFLNR